MVVAEVRRLVNIVAVNIVLVLHLCLPGGLLPAVLSIGYTWCQKRTSERLVVLLPKPTALSITQGKFMGLAERKLRRKS